MKSLLKSLLFVLLIHNDCFSQSIPENAKYQEKVNILLFENNDTIENKFITVYYDSLWNKISTEKKTTKEVLVSETPTKKVKASLNLSGDTLVYFVSNLDEKGRVFENYNIRNGKKESYQLRKYNDNDDLTQIFMKDPKGNLYLFMEYEYNESNLLVKKIRYNSNNTLVQGDIYRRSEMSLTHVQYIYGQDPVVISYDKELDKNTHEITFFSKQEKIYYSTKLNVDKNYYVIEKTNDRERVISYEFFNSDKILIASFSIVPSEI